VEPCSPRIVTRQIEAIFGELPPAAIKTGMLLSARIIRAVADALRDRPCRPLVLDPVMVATSGARLLEPAAIRTLLNRLFPLAQLVTPNLHEAELLCGNKLTSVEHLRGAAHLLHRRFGIAALVKGGHLRGLKEAVDIFYDGREELLLSAPFVKGVSTHGTGCTYSAAITAHLARGATLAAAVSKAKLFITGAIVHSQQAAEHSVLNTRWS
jgi:hydroxymethylpyrimidine/phosphomethylpyrimidine kinase